MFKNNHYVPVIRWRKSEYSALSEISNEYLKFMTPLIEIFPRDFDTRERRKNKKPYPYTPDPFQVLLDKVNQFSSYWGESPFFVDTLHIPEDIVQKYAKHPIEIILENSYKKGLNPIPVTSTFRTNHFNTAIKRSLQYMNNKEICLRLECEEVKDNSISTKINKMLNYFSITEKETNLIIDCKITDEYKDYVDLVNKIPQIAKWKTFTITSGAFPKDLSDFNVGENKLMRKDWNKWNALQTENIKRYPSFGDYTIQYPYLNEPPRGFNMSASIRYTSEKYWVIMRGMGMKSKNSKGYAQYPANAQMLCYRDEFCGGVFCAGDKYIEDMAGHQTKKGTPSTWLQAGINHHLTLVIHQIMQSASSKGNHELNF